MFEICSMNIHYRFFDLKYFFNSCKNNEINNAELWLCPQHFYINSQKCEIDIEKVKKLAERNNVKICCLCPEQNNPKPSNMAARDSHLIKNSMNYFKKVIQLAKHLSAPQILLTSGWAYYDEAENEAWSRSVRHMKEVSEYAKMNDVKICLEPLQPQESLLVNNLKSMIKYIEDVSSENLFVALDLGALGKSNESMQSWFDEFHKKIIHIHYVDGNPTGHMPIGKGERDVVEDMKCLLRADYSGVLSFEFAGSMSFTDPSQMDKDSKKIIDEALNQIKNEGIVND